MNFLNSDDIIIACSTSTSSNAAIAVIRISGFENLILFQKFFSQNLEKVTPRKVYFTQLISDHDVLDSICLTFFKGPNSYNGENVLELSVHGNLLNIENILNLFLRDDLCRLASPGEFTYRALRNKKLTLSQVEGLDLLLNATSNFALSQGNSLLHGDLGHIYENLLQNFLTHKSSLELLIDFSDDVGDEQALAMFNQSLDGLSKILTRLKSRCDHSHFNLSEPTIAFFGLPNAGKSTIFNFLLNEDRSIVSSIAGTTRDFISENYKVEGVLFKLIDTAGIRESSDLIEVEGVKKALNKLETTFFKVLVINPIDHFSHLNLIKNQTFDLIVFTHSDLGDFKNRLQEFKSHQDAPIGPELIFDSLKFKDQFESFVNKKYLQEISHDPILLSRHKYLIFKAFEVLSFYKTQAKSDLDLGILSSELNTLGDCISELIGIVSPDDLLKNIFENFCIGK